MKQNARLNRRFAELREEQEEAAQYAVPIPPTPKPTAPIKRVNRVVLSSPTIPQKVAHLLELLKENRPSTQTLRVKKNAPSAPRIEVKIVDSRPAKPGRRPVVNPATFGSTKLTVIPLKPKYRKKAACQRFVRQRMAELGLIQG